ncbi:MAG: T9SS type A sorting domain-containing protein, partial [bacterium]|nr:T9SS type A sorting domain-containing protein [bacterium]
YTGMEAVSASLITISTVGDQYNGAGWELNSASNSNGDTFLSFSVPYLTQAELVLYDLAGREVEQIWTGAGSGMLDTCLIGKTDNPAGMYFAVLSGDGFLLSEKCIIW